MEKDAHEAVPRDADKPPALVRALDKSEQVQIKVEECAEELAFVNTKMKEDFTEHLPLAEIEQVLSQSEDIETKVEECAEDLNAVNAALGHEITERKQLERALSQSQADLSDTRVELTATQRAEEMASHRALHDVLTGLPNRALFNDRLKQALAEAKRHGWNSAVLFIDLDQFKTINDTYGHQTGDQVLRVVAERLQAAIRAVDTVSRHGGDECLCLLQEVHEPADVAAVANKILTTMSASCEMGGVTLTVQPSIGIALYPSDGETPAVLLKCADAAMYRAKEDHTGYCFSHQLDANARSIET